MGMYDFSEVKSWVGGLRWDVEPQERMSWRRVCPWDGDSVRMSWERRANAVLVGVLVSGESWVGIRRWGCLSLVSLSAASSWRKARTRVRVRSFVRVRLPSGRRLMA